MITRYSVLLVGQLTLLTLLFVFKYNYSYQIVIGLAISVFYISWSLWHHSVGGRLTKEIATEYVLIGTFIFLLILIALI